MSKYIIEIPDDVQYVLLNGKADHKYYTAVHPIAELEELNSDYINEHFGDLQDDAYQRGLDDGRNETWEAVKKISLMSPDEIEKVFPGAAKYNRYNLGYSGVEAIEKLKAYEEKQKEEDDIKLGDEVEHTVSGYTSKAIFLEKIKDDEDWYKCLFWTGCGVTILSYPKRQFKRTGRHFDIDKILEEMKE